MPPFRFFKRFHRARLIEVNHPVELVAHIRSEVVAYPLGLWTVDHANSALQPRARKQLCLTRAVSQIQKETRDAALVKPKLVALRQRGPDALTLARVVPVGSGGHCSGVGRETDEH